MTMNITSKQMEITPAIRQHVADRLAKLEKWQTHLINPHIILSKEPQGFVADATINTPNGVLVASGKSTSWNGSSINCSTKAKHVVPQHR